MTPSQGITPAAGNRPAASRPVALIVLDGWGISTDTRANAVYLADTPVFDRLMAGYRSTSLRASGPDVGLPVGQMGNSEVGHLTMGAGLVIDQDLTRIGKATSDGSLGHNATLGAVFAHVRHNGSSLHLAGILGDGGVHGHSDHVLALIDLAKAAGIKRVFVHAFTDGRDTAPDSALGFMRTLESGMSALGLGRVATVCGRYWAMDRDKRWERTERAWRAIRRGGDQAPTGEAAILAAYAAGETDEFIQPRVVLSGSAENASAEMEPARLDGRLRDDDAIILWNFRADRMRQLLAVLTEPRFAGFTEVDRPTGLHVATMTEYVKGQLAPALFAPQDIRMPLARVIADAGGRQYHTAETEKYAHVTYFFNGGREQLLPGETHHLVPSAKVATYDLQPEMSAVALTDSLVRRIHESVDDFILVNFANPDMVGHTGVLEAAIKAVETVDTCLGRVLEALAAKDGAALVTADHGNCEQMIDPLTGGPHTAHTLNPVPLIVVHDDLRLAAGQGGFRLADGGALRDVAPTVLSLMGLAQPAEMTGHCLIERLPTPAGAAS